MVKLPNFAVKIGKVTELDGKISRIYRNFTELYSKIGSVKLPNLTMKYLEFTVTLPNRFTEFYSKIGKTSRIYRTLHLNRFGKVTELDSKISRSYRNFTVKYIEFAVTLLNRFTELYSKIGKIGSVKLPNLTVKYLEFTITLPNFTVKSVKSVR